MHKRGMPRFSFEKLLSHSIGKPRRGTLLCFRIFLVSNNFMDKRGGGEYHDFASEIYCRTVLKKIIGESFSASLISSVENFHA